MATLLKRLSVTINEKMGRSDEAFTPKALASSTSFNDFSLHVGNEGEAQGGAARALGSLSGVLGSERRNAAAHPSASLPYACSG